MEPIKLIKCNECGKVYSKKSNLNHHMRLHHPDKAVFPVRNKVFKYQCEDCKKNFNDLTHFKYHRRKFHTGFTRNKNFKCSLCDFHVPKTNELYDHFEEIHKIQLKCTTHNFETVDQFYSWKRKMENESEVQFIKNQKTHLAKFGLVTKYVCHRSGTYTAKGKGLRKIKRVGTNKIGGFCPAYIKLITKANGTCEVTFFKTHVGHENDIRRVFLNTIEKQLLAAKLSKQASLDEILNEVHQTEESFETRRFRLVTRKDLHNVKRNFASKKIDSVQLIDKRRRKEGNEEADSEQEHEFYILRNDDFTRNESDNADMIEQENKNSLLTDSNEKSMQNEYSKSVEEMLYIICDDKLTVEEVPENTTIIENNATKEETTGNPTQLLEERKEKLKSTVCKIIDDLRTITEVKTVEKLFETIACSWKEDNSDSKTHIKV